jgi:hypothetical protein
MNIVTQDDTDTKSAWHKLNQFLLQRNTHWHTVEEAPAFASFERELHEQLMALERALLGDELARYDVNSKEVEVDGERYRRVMSSGKNYLTTAGEVRVERHLYRRVGDPDERCICPLDYRVGIIGGYATPRAARQMSWVTAHLPPRTAAELFEEIGGMKPSHTTIDQQPKMISDQWETDRPTWENALRQAEDIPATATTLAVSMDGVMVPINQEDGTKKTAAPGKQASGPQGYREIGCGSVSLYDQTGERLQTVRYGRMPEHKKATLRQQLTAECQHILQQAPHLKVVKLADGARDNWDYLSNLDLGLPAAATEQMEIVDFCHAADHLKRGCDAIWFRHPDQCQAEFESLRLALKEEAGGVDKVRDTFMAQLASLSAKGKEALQTELTYFDNQRHRMDYATYIQQGLPIASGVIEATCKTLVTQRMKCSGMRWSSPGGQAVLTLRALVQSGRWQQAWRLIEAQFRIPVSIVKEQLAHQRHKGTDSQVASWPTVPSRINSARDYDSLPLAT